jgi:hypothetical protein
MSHQEQQPDPSATTQQFQQFVRRGDAEAAATSSSGKTGPIIIGVVIAVLVVAVAAYFLL